MNTINLVISESGAEIIDGKPEYYVTDEDFKRLLDDKEFAIGIYKEFGRRVCIGRLGKKNDDGVYSEEYNEVVNFDGGTGNLNSLGFYEKIK